ncbi:unnamed protein product [Leptidea sinapis]|uniref:C2H2-type domain-containing protein n=1 Tax=Leptidea sinapis TaxID=189913 RepID=A0A5E4QR88_9NEOP|nr:unnamed protein product [Leptidea sinapis]
MRTTSFSLEVLALLFLTLIPWPGPSVFKITCSRDNSKIVRKVIQNKWLPVLERFKVKLPLECPFHAARDIFAPHNAAKLQHRSSQWTCAFCGKSFYEERHLDAHFDQRHKNLINKAEDAVCLADYCDIMRCQVLITHGLLSGGAVPSTDVEVWQDVETARKALAPAATRSVAKVPARRRHRRTSPPLPVSDCPRTEPENEDEDLTGSGEKRREERDDGDTNQTSELCDADTVESSLPPDKDRTFLHRDTPSTSHAASVYRTRSCDRYWEDTTPAARVFPWPLLLALATGLALALCMCYYIIWIVFDSEEGSVAGSASVSMTTHSSPTRGDRLGGDDAMLDDDDHYIYVTYPPELKRRLLESCYNRTTRL